MDEQKNSPGQSEKRMDIAAKTSNPILTPEQLKSFFYLAAGKLDSNIKIFNRKIVIDENDLIELNDLIQEKLRNHDTTASVASINISFRKNKIKQFGAWGEFTKSNWKIPEVIEGITVIWDFLVKLPQYTQPQRHTLTVKITANANPAVFFSAMLSGNINEIDSVELRHSPVVCQVDFINHLLSDELLSIVDKWVESRKTSASDGKIKKWIQKHGRVFSDLISYSVPLFITVTSLSILYGYEKSIDGTELSVTIMMYCMYWLLLSIVSIFGFAKISNRLAHYSFRAISEYGDFLIFNITNGDKNEQAEVDRKNKKEFRKFIFGACTALLINIVSTIITYKLS